MKLQSVFIYLLLICTSYSHAGIEEPENRNLPELPHSCNEMLVSQALSSDQPASSLVYLGKDGRLIYKPYTDKGDKILDFSICGYKLSEEPIPDVPVVATVNPLQGETTADGTMAYPEETVTPESMFMQQLIDRIGN